MKGKRLVIAGLVLIVLAIALICYPIYSMVGAVVEVPEAAEVGLQSYGYYRITSFDGDKTFKVEWTSDDLNPESYNQFFCYTLYTFECVDGYAVKPPPVGRYCVKIGAQKLDCDLAIPGIQKAADYQEIRWRDTVQVQRCYAYMPKLKLCPPCPVCEPEQAAVCSPDGCN